jgi:hypothetical protein
LYVGGAVAGLGLAPLGYLLVFGLWDVALLLGHRRRLKDRETAKSIEESKKISLGKGET